MAISTKKRRKIQLDGRPFIWWVAPDLESAGVPTLHICSSDKRFHVHYPLGPETALRHLVVLGPEFPPLQDAGGCRVRVRAPAWEDQIITPAVVRQIVAWGLDATKSVQRVTWLGAPLE
jgi:hypothetical protein